MRDYSESDYGAGTAERLAYLSILAAAGFASEEEQTELHSLKTWPQAVGA